MATLNERIQDNLELEQAKILDTWAKRFQSLAAEADSIFQNHVNKRNQIPGNGLPESWITDINNRISAGKTILQDIINKY